MADDKIVRLVHLLLERTKAGDIRWEETSSANTFQCSLPNYSVVISQRPLVISSGTVSLPTHALTLCNEEGKIIEELSDAVPSLLGGVELRELFEASRRSAMGVEKALDEILNLLGASEGKR
jgi:hypothetical protein